MHHAFAALLAAALTLAGCAHGQSVAIGAGTPPPLPTGHMHITVDNVLAELWINGSRLEVPEFTANDWTRMSSVSFGVLPGRNVIAVKAVDQGVIAGLLADIDLGVQTLISDHHWTWALTEQDGWHAVGFDDTSWGLAQVYGQYPLGVWGDRVHGVSGEDTEAIWIWSPANILDGERDPVVYFSYVFEVEPGWVVR